VSLASPTHLFFLFLTFQLKMGSSSRTLRVFVVGNPSPDCNNRPHSHVDFKFSSNPFPQENNAIHQSLGSSAACKDPPPPHPRIPFDPMALLKMWGGKMQLMHQQQPQMIIVESRADKSRES
jgi:hypothetical protein